MLTHPITHKVAVLFARKNSIYHSYPECDVYDKQRNALTYKGGLPIIAHPPCRAWGGLSHFAKPEEGEKELANWSIEQIRQHGGILEHPRTSRLWKEMNLPLGMQVDAYGGYSLSINQSWFGHLARKATLLYVCGIPRGELLPVCYSLDAPTHVVTTSKRKSGFRLLELSDALREGTPPMLAEWLIENARRIGVHSPQDRPGPPWTRRDAALPINRYHSC